MSFEDRNLTPQSDPDLLFDPLSETAKESSSVSAEARRTEGLVDTHPQPSIVDHSVFALRREYHKCNQLCESSSSIQFPFTSPKRNSHQSSYQNHYPCAVVQLEEQKHLPNVYFSGVRDKEPNFPHHHMASREFETLPGKWAQRKLTAPDTSCQNVKHQSIDECSTVWHLSPIRDISRGARNDGASEVPLCSQRTQSSPEISEEWRAERARLRLRAALQLEYSQHLEAGTSKTSARQNSPPPPYHAVSPL